MSTKEALHRKADLVRKAKKRIDACMKSKWQIEQYFWHDL